MSKNLDRIDVALFQITFEINLKFREYFILQYIFDVDDVRKIIDQIRYRNKRFFIIRNVVLICRFDYDVLSIVILTNCDRTRHIYNKNRSRLVIDNCQ